MMSDICGFTTLAEHLPPPKVVSLLNRYFEHMTSIIFQHEGTIDEFLGDAILAGVRRTQTSDDDPERLYEARWPCEMLLPQNIGQ